MKEKQLMVYLENDQDVIAVTYKLRMLLRRAILETLAYEGIEITAPEVSMTFTDNEGIRELNRIHRGIDRATDVLSFPMFSFEDETEELEGALGDIVISLERAAEQAQTFGHSFEREVVFLCVHSMLHLLGYDHELGAEEEAKQIAAQKEIISRLDI